jgi:SH3 domain-containing YSC84-like protein 1
MNQKLRLRAMRVPRTMRTILETMLLGLSLALAFVCPALAQDKEADRVTNAGKVTKEILDAPDDIPKSVLDTAYCVVILPSVFKISLGLGSSFGRGVMTCRGG